MVDLARLRGLLDRLRDEVAELRRLANYQGEELLGDRDRLNAVKYLFVVTAEICIDVGNHVIASEGLRAPQTFAEVFTVLGEADYVSQELAGHLEAMARFRNLLVHQYAEIDDERVVEILHTRLDDFDRFRELIAAIAPHE